MANLRDVINVEARPEPVDIRLRQTAVIVVDMQNDFASPGGMFDRAGIDVSPIRDVVEPTRRVLAAARRAGVKIVYLKMEFRRDLSDAGGPASPNRIKHQPLGLGGSGSILVENTWNTEILPELAPEPGDIVVSKHRYSGFYETDLDLILRGLGVQQLLFTGCTTSVCVESTLRDAMYRDYTCLLLLDCVAEPIGYDLSRTNHDASLLVTQLLFGWVTDSAAVLRALEVPPIAAQAGGG